MRWSSHTIIPEGAARGTGGETGVSNPTTWGIPSVILDHLKKTNTAEMKSKVKKI